MYNLQGKEEPKMNQGPCQQEMITHICMSIVTVCASFFFFEKQTNLYCLEIYIKKNPAQKKLFLFSQHLHLC
jgi:hypothetical protein